MLTAASPQAVRERVGGEAGRHGEIARPEILDVGITIMAPKRAIEHRMVEQAGA